MEYTIITEETISLAQSSKGGFTKAALAALGVSWPPLAGWRQRIIGDFIIQERVNSLPVLRNKKEKKKSREWKRLNRKKLHVNNHSRNPLGLPAKI